MTQAGSGAHPDCVNARHAKQRLMMLGREQAIAGLKAQRLGMAIQVFSEFLREFEQPITQFASNAVQQLAAAIDTPIRVAVTLWIVLYGSPSFEGLFGSRSWLCLVGRPAARDRGARDQRLHV